MYAFTLSLHRRLAPEGDLVWSPYSVASALALLAAGARGRTYEELAGVLGAPPSRLGLAPAARPRGAEVAVANALWARAGVAFEEEYERALADLPGSALHVADFAAAADRARQDINADVAKVTRDLITDLLPPGAVDASTAAVLVNALYLKAAWAHAFPPRDTRSGTFRAPDGPREVPMMRRTGRMPYGEAGGWRMVTLETEGDVVADVLLPPEDLEDPVAPDSPELLRELYASARAEKVALALPRFRAEGRAGLGDALAALGVVTAFGDGADLSGMAAEDLRVDRIEHKAVLDVDETGFEGAAATAAVVALAAFDAGRPREFRADRPFLFLVRHPATESIYFATHVTHP